MTQLYVKADESEMAKCYMKFYIDIIKNKEVFSLSCFEAIKHSIKGLNNEYTQRKEISAADALFEDIIADVLLHRYRMISTAENIGIANATGYDVCDISNNIFIEAKAYSVCCSGSYLGASVGNIKNKFCSVVILVIDPFLFKEKGYQLYLIPPEGIPSDLSTSIRLNHHKILEVTKDDTKYQLIEQLGSLGQAKSIYQINSLSDLLTTEAKQIIQSINVKKLAMVLRGFNESAMTSSQEVEYNHLMAQWTYVIRTSNKKIKSKTKFPIDFKNEIYDIKVENNIRFIFKNDMIVRLEDTPDEND